MKRRTFVKSAGIAVLVASYPAWEGFTHDGNLPNELKAITGDGNFTAIKTTDIIDFRKSLEGKLLLAKVAVVEVKEINVPVASVIVTLPPQRPEVPPTNEVILTIRTSVDSQALKFV